MPYNRAQMVESVVDPAGLRRFSVEEYHRMGTAGVFGRNERVELIRGVIRQMSPKGRRHIIAVEGDRAVCARPDRACARLCPGPNDYRALAVGARS